MTDAGKQCLGKRDGSGPVPRHAALALWLIVAALASGCAPQIPLEAPTPQPIFGINQLLPAERSFLTRVAGNSLYEAEVSRLAAVRATSPQVRSFAQRLADDYAKTNNELAALMRARGLQPPATLAADKATKLHRLSELKPSPDFDNGYVRVVGLEDQMTSIALFEQAQREARDRELKAWIDKTLPLLRARLAAAQTLSGSQLSRLP